MNDEQRALASAALDGALTTEERARADADHEVVREVERLRDVRDALRVTDPPDRARREAALVAALATFDTERGARVVAPPAPTVRRRARWMAPLAAAAAVAVIVVGAVVAGRGGQRGNDDSAATADLQMSEATVADEAGEPATAPAAPEADQPADATEAAGTEAATEATQRVASGDAEELEPPLETLRSAADLARFTTTSAGVDQLSEGGRCPGDDFVGVAVYEINGAAVVVEVFVTSDEAVALDQATCAEVARTPLD